MQRSWSVVTKKHLLFTDERIEGLKIRLLRAGIEWHNQLLLNSLLNIYKIPSTTSRRPSREGVKRSTKHRFSLEPFFHCEDSQPTRSVFAFLRFQKCDSDSSRLGKKAVKLDNGSTQRISSGTWTPCRSAALIPCGPVSKGQCLAF